MIFVVGEFEQNGMTVSMKQGKPVILTTHWKDRAIFLNRCRRKIAASCNRRVSGRISQGCIARSARYLGADVSFSGKRSTTVRKPDCLTPPNEDAS